ncbi:RSF1 [Auxenochlorella protothecoides x Auxenochlorella symbiontica]
MAVRLDPVHALHRPAPFAQHPGRAMLAAWAPGFSSRGDCHAKPWQSVGVKGRSASRAHALRAASHPPPPQASGFGPPAPSFAPDSPSEDASTAEAFALARTLARVAEEGKGGNTRALHVAPLVYWTRVMVLSTVTNRPQLRAMLARMEAEALSRHGATPAPGPGPGRSTWELLDFGDVVVHLQTADQRAFYDLEGLYADAEDIELDAVAAQDQAAGASYQVRL